MQVTTRTSAGRTPQRARRLRLVIGAVAVLLVLVAAARLPEASRTMNTVEADFADTTGIYVGNEVQYLGVPIGKITGIEPHGTVMTVQMEVDAAVALPREAGAEILQSALLTDRYVQIGPAYRGGARLPDGAHISAAHTRSPMSIDDVSKAVDDLVRALDQTGPGGHDVGDLLHATAVAFDGNGEDVRNLLVSSRQALAAINTKSPDLKAVVGNLAVITDTLAARDGTIRRLTENLAVATDGLAEQSPELSRTLGSLRELTASVDDFVTQNRSRLTGNLRDVAAVAETIHQQQDALSEVFDLMPTGAENITRAFDEKRGGLRVQIAVRDFLLFSNLVRAEYCASWIGPYCMFLFTPEGTGALDVLLDLLRDILPTRYPWN